MRHWRRSRLNCCKVLELLVLGKVLKSDKVEIHCRRNRSVSGEADAYDSQLLLFILP